MKASEEKGLGLIGVIKKAPHQKKRENMQKIEFTCRGYCYGLVLVDEVVTDIMAFLWVNHDGCYFVVTRGYHEEGTDILRKRWP